MAFARAARLVGQRIMRDCSALAPLSLLPMLSAFLMPRRAEAVKVQFTPVPKSSLDPATAREVEAAVAGVDGWFYIAPWIERGRLIRGSGNRAECLGNLSLALNGIGNLNEAEYTGAAGALTLLPTAGALLGAPTQELWLLFKLMPIAGLLSMCLSLGASITPSTAAEYDPEKPRSYGGLMPSTWQSKRSHLESRVNSAFSNLSEDLQPVATDTPADAFAKRVKLRAFDLGGGDSYYKVWLGVVVQLSLIAILLVPMWYAQTGAVIIWWCNAWGWMYFWYFLTVCVSILDSVIAEPFSKSYKLRVSRAPSNLVIGEETPCLQNLPDATALEVLKRGINTQSMVTIGDVSTDNWSRTCFYVILSVEGMSTLRAILQSVSKGCSIAVYAFGTTLFASATLLASSVSLMVLCLVLFVAIMGRIVAMWMALEMDRHNEPILHAIVRDDSMRTGKGKTANEYIQSIINQKGLQIEILGHILVDGKVVVRRSNKTAWSTYIGVLAKPFDLVSMALRSPHDDLRSRVRTDSSNSQSNSMGKPFLRAEGVHVENYELQTASQGTGLQRSQDSGQERHKPISDTIYESRAGA